MRLSLMFPVMPNSVDSAYPYADLVIERGLSRLWFGTSLFLSEQVVMSALAARYRGLHLGSAVALTPLRTVGEMAVTSRSIGAVAGAPFTLGIGAGGASLQRALHGAEYQRPGTVVRDYVEAIRKLLTGQRVPYESEAFHIDSSFPRIPAPPVELGVGVLRPRMARLTGQCADAAIAWMASPRYLADTIIPELEAGAASAERAVPRVVAVLHAAVRKSRREPIALVHGALSGHLASPHYRDMLKMQGIDVSSDDPGSAARSLIDAGIFAYGDSAEIADTMRSYQAAGVDELVLNVCGLYSQEGAMGAFEGLLELLDIAADVSSGESR